MNSNGLSYRVVDFPVERRGMAAYQDIKPERHNIYALLAVDVTAARRTLQNYEAQTGEALSFTGFLISCLAQAVAEDMTIQSYRIGSRKLALFDEVDVGFMVELKKGEQKVVRGHVIRQANQKTFWEIHQEIRAVQSNQQPSDSEKVAWFRTALLLPFPLSWIFKTLFRIAIRRNPGIVIAMAGTVGISSVGMFGKGHAGWGISIGTHALDLVVGGISRQLAEVEGRIETREMLHITVIFDHDVIDGAPAARFTSRLVELIECGHGLAGMALS